MAGIVVLIEITQSVALLEKGVSSGESRFSTRALRASAAIRHKLNAKVLTLSISSFFPKGNVYLFSFQFNTNKTLCENAFNILHLLCSPP
jgi:hypothetical protein